jgi:hypothetical protein
MNSELATKLLGEWLFETKTVLKIDLFGIITYERRGSIMNGELEIPVVSAIDWFLQ